MTKIKTNQNINFVDSAKCSMHYYILLLIMYT